VKQDADERDGEDERRQGDGAEKQNGSHKRLL